MGKKKKVKKKSTHTWMGTGSSTIQFVPKARAISPEKDREKFQWCLKWLQGMAWQGERSWLLLFGGWVKLAAPSLLQSKETISTIRNSSEMHLTLTITLNIQQFIPSQHKVWIFCLQEKGNGYNPRETLHPSYNLQHWVQDSHFTTMIV